MIPPHVQRLFWDTDIEHFDPSRHPRYTIERVLEHGDEDSVGWLLQVFTRDEIRAVLRGRHHLTPRSANFWTLVFQP
jgi:hypothetical protein